jgi:hypothetical protein
MGSREIRAEPAFRGRLSEAWGWWGESQDPDWQLRGRNSRHTQEPPPASASHAEGNMEMADCSVLKKSMSDLCCIRIMNITVLKVCLQCKVKNIKKEEKKYTFKQVLYTCSITTYLWVGEL